MNEKKVFGIVYDPLNTHNQLLLGFFISSSVPQLFEGENKLSFNNLLFVADNRELFVGMTKNKGRIYFYFPGYEEEAEFVFYLTTGIKRDNPWAWRDRNHKVWMSTEEFGRFLTYLTNIKP